jgi:hypothetical protein
MPTISVFFIIIDTLPSLLLLRIQGDRVIAGGNAGSPWGEQPTIRSTMSGR